MKKILSILGIITLIGTSTTSLVSCNKPQYSEEELKELKEKNKINTVNQEIRDNLEWIAPQETPFNKVDDKWYFVVWRNDDNSGNWKINKFQNNVKLNIGESYTINDSLLLFNGNFSSNLKIDLQVILKNGVPLGWFFDRDNSFLKLVYRWNLITQNNPNLKIDNDGNLKVDE